MPAEADSSLKSESQPGLRLQAQLKQQREPYSSFCGGSGSKANPVSRAVSKQAAAASSGQALCALSYCAHSSEDVVVEDISSRALAARLVWVDCCSWG